MKLSLTHTVDHKVFSSVQTLCQQASMRTIAVPGGCTCSCPSSSSCSCGAVSVTEACEAKH